MQGIYYFISLLIVYLLLLLLIKSIRDFNYRYLSEIFTVIGGVGLTICDIMSDNESTFISKYKWNDAWPYLFAISSIILVSAVIISAKRNEINKNIKQQIQINQDLQSEIKIFKDEYYKLCSNNILLFFKDFLKQGSERVSIYKFNDNHFILLGRFSRTQKFNRKTDYNYSIDEGIIGKGWHDGTSYVMNAPLWEKNNKKSYNNFMKQLCMITDKRLDKIVMKSRSLYAITLHDDTTAEDPDGIIVFESTLPYKVIPEECEKMISENKNGILRLLKSMKTLTEKVHV